MSIRYSPWFTSSGSGLLGLQSCRPPCSSAGGGERGGPRRPVRRRPVQTVAVLAVPATGLRLAACARPCLPGGLAAARRRGGAALRPTGGPWNGGSGEVARPMSAGRAAARSRRRPATARLRGGGGVAGALGREGEGASRGRTRARAGSRRRLGQVGNRLKFGPCEGIGLAVGGLVVFGLK